MLSAFHLLRQLNDQSAVNPSCQRERRAKEETANDNLTSITDGGLRRPISNVGLGTRVRIDLFVCDA